MRKPGDTLIHFSSATNEWSTPQDFYDSLDAEFGFVLDPCATSDNAKCAFYYDQESNGLERSWLFGPVFMNPPYGREIGKWVAKAHETAQAGGLVVCLIPSRTDTTYWHKYVIEPGYEVRFIKGRLKFGNNSNSAPFPSAVVIMRCA